jgi:hypothetical protein
MSGWQIFFAIVGLSVTLAGLIMALARTPPNDAISNLSEWVQWAGLHHIPIWLRDRTADDIAFRWARISFFALLLIGLGGGYHFWMDNQQPTAIEAPSPLPSGRERLSQEEVATRLGVWDSVSNSNLNVLINAYNNIDLALSRWSRMLDSAENRQQLHNDIINSTAAFVMASKELETLRSEYTQYADISSALAQPRLVNLEKASLDLSNAIDPHPRDASADLEIKLRPLAGALRREMNFTSEWMTSLQRLANEKRRELSEYPTDASPMPQRR